MTIRKIYLTAVMGLAMFSCQNNDSVTDVNPDDIFKQTNVFPVPPNQWMGGNNPYYTAGYVGDVMPYYENGIFHLFFLHDAKNKPAGEGFHDIHSFDTSNFKDFNYQGRQIPYGLASEPDFGVGTGSLVKVGNTYYYYYTGHNEVASFISSNPRESVLLATSTDLKNWTKVKNFKMTAPAGYYDYEYRDPHVFFNSEDGKYWMLVSAQTSAKKAVVLKYTTTNPASGNWTVENPIYTTSASENYIMLECPDLFKMGNYWYLVFSENWSSNSGTHYRIATSPNGPWTTPANDRFDGSYLYAAKTVSDNTDRYLVGWTARKVPESNTGGKDWAGNLVTHKLVQNSDGTLGVKPVSSIASVFGNNASLSVDKIIGTASQNGNSFNLSGTSQVMFSKLQKANQISFTLNASSNGQSGLILSQDNDGQNGYKIAFEPANNRIASYVMSSGSQTLDNAYPLSGISGTNYNVTAYISNDVCVVYVNDKVAFSNRVYDVVNKKWSIFGTSNSTFSNINIKNP
ncbi:glycoside hydrolase family 32 protein [Chryseobacterium sp.]|uniref:glycoside hydrolase family 32 protein n=1 Tax=Chryseobacterium sp. TaxID=1871047 RepID=UPI00289883C3|nr:glycoside hydrolase family 32 protein [Chryseobacterium sp.]